MAKTKLQLLSAGTITAIALGAIFASCKGMTYENESSQKIFRFDVGSAVRVSNLSTNTSETGQAATFTVHLTALPAADVIIGINEKADSKNNANQEGTVDKQSLTFTPANYSVPQTVTVTGVDDNLADGNIQYTIKIENAVSSDPVYNGVAPSQNVTVNNLDNDTPGFEIVANGSTTLTATSAATVTGLATDDAAQLSVAVYSTFTIRLRSAPSANVTLNLSRSIAHDGTLNSSSLVFTTTKDQAVAGTTSGWNVAQTIVVTGGSNTTNEGNHDYLINFAIVTTDTKYSNSSVVAVPSVTIHSCDNDVANVVVACRRSGGFGTSESGGTATVWFIAQSAPGSAVTIPVTTSNAAEGTVTSPATVDSSNWNTMLAAGTNRVVATGVQDSGTFDGPITYNLVVANPTTGGVAYTGFNPPDVSIANADDEVSLTYTAASGNTTEAGTATATFGIRLAVAPATSVTFSIACNAATECASVNPTSMTFTSANYTVAQTVTITPIDDNRADGDQPQCVSFGAFSADPILGGVVAPGVCPMNNVDNDKLIWVTTTPKNGNYNAGMTVADSNCNDANDPNFPSGFGGTYKALLADASTRIATTTGTDATGQTNWVMRASTAYYLKTGAGPTYNSTVFTTNTFGLFTFGALTTAFSASGADNFWTGLNTNWTTAANTCSNWTSNTPGVQGQYGVGASTAAAAINSAANGDCGNDLKKLICVQQ